MRVGKQYLGWIRTQPRVLKKWSWPTSPIPRNLPNGSKVCHRRSFWTQKSWRNFSLKSIQKPKWVKKVAPGFQKHFLYLFLLFLWVLRWAEISAALGDFLKILTCGSKNFQKSLVFKNVKKHHFSTFVVFLLHFGQSGPSCLHLPNFASQKFLRT